MDTIYFVNAVSISSFDVAREYTHNRIPKAPFRVIAVAVAYSNRVEYELYGITPRLPVIIFVRRQRLTRPLT